MRNFTIFFLLLVNHGFWMHFNAKYKNCAENDSIWTISSKASYKNNCLLKEIGVSKQFTIRKSPKIEISERCLHKRPLTIFVSFLNKIDPEL